MVAICSCFAIAAAPNRRAAMAFGVEILATSSPPSIPPTVLRHRGRCQPLIASGPQQPHGGPLHATRYRRAPATLPADQGSR